MGTDISYEYLFKEYVENNKSALAIAKELGYGNAGFIQQLLTRYNIPKKNKSMKGILNKELLQKLYLDERKSIYQIAVELNIKSETTVSYHLKKFGIPIRAHSDRVYAKKSKSKKWKGYEEISGAYWWTILNGAKSRKIEVNITIEDAWNVYQKQNGKCALSGIYIYFPNDKLEDQTASLDRINSNENYNIENIQWIHKDLQFMKWDYNENYFIDFCEKIVKYKRGC